MKIAYNLTLDNIIDACGGRLVTSGDGTNPLVFNEIFTDSREKFSKNSVFIALKGRNFNGEEFVGKAFENGASCAIVSWDFLDNSDLSDFSGKIIIAASDTTDALGDIARMYIGLFEIKKRICITGSCGKTTTKEMVYKIFSDKYGQEKVLRNEFNFNNLIGVPKTILGINKKHEFLILEIGSNKKGEIKKLASIISPDVAAITNIGKSHLEEFKDLKGVLTEKFSLAKELKRGSYLILNRDDKNLNKTMGSIPGVNFLSFEINPGDKPRVVNKDADLICRKIAFNDKNTELEIEFMGGVFPSMVRLKGIHLVYDYLCALLISYACGIDIEFSISSLSEFGPPSGRMEEKESASGEYLLINDSYNSNPDSLKAALDSINTYYPDKNKILVLGDMLELGSESENEHYKAGLESAKIAGLIFYKGYYYNNFREGLKAAGFDMTRLFFFDDPGLFREKFSVIDKNNSVVLIKASRGIALEKYFDELGEEHHVICG